MSNQQYRHARSCLEGARDTMLGYPLNLAAAPFIATQVQEFLGHVINNLGDPCVGSSCGMNTFEAERSVVGSFARLFHIDYSAAWGYVTSCGSEGNLRGISFGAQKMGHLGTIFTSNAGHYSIDKAARICGLEIVKIPTNRDGDFATELMIHRIKKHGTAAIVVLTAGTMMTGAVDPIHEVAARIREEIKDPCYIHVDAALSGLILPFLEDSPIFDFRAPIDSISVSGHKMLGTPVPCGIFVARKDSLPSQERVSYIDSTDTTIGGSRLGLAPLCILAAMDHYSGRERNLKTVVRACIDTARYAQTGLKALGIDARLNPHCNTVVFPRAPLSLIKKWQLASDMERSHIITMPHVSETMIDRFISDYKNAL